MDLTTTPPSDVRVAIVIDPALPPGLVANTAGAIGIGLGAAMPALAAVRLQDAAGRRFAVGSTLPVPILKADEAALRALLLRAFPVPEGAVLVPFPRFARAIHDFASYRDAVPLRDLADEPLEGIGLAGPTAWVRSLTGSLPLLR